MKNVNHSIRLTFKFRRERAQMLELNEMQDATSQNDPSITTENSSLSRKHHHCPTRVVYDIEYSKDHGEKKRLLTVEVQAKNNYPSAQEAVPMDGDDGDDDNDNSIENDHGDEFIEDESNMMDENKIQDSMSIVSQEQSGSGADLYAAYVDPETLQDFLQSAGLELNAENSLFFLMTFPFYEHEWDIFGFLLDCVFGGDDESDDYEDMSDKSSADGSDS